MAKAIPVYCKGSIVAHAQVDDEDFEAVSKFKWSLHNRGYAITGGGNSKMLMHRMILGLQNERGGGRGSGATKSQADHINADKLDNRRANLRVVTNQENHQNRQVSRGTSRYRGVYFHKASGKWSARAKLNGKTYWAGLHELEEDAGMAAWRLRMELMPFCAEGPPVDDLKVLR